MQVLCSADKLQNGFTRATSLFVVTSVGLHSVALGLPAATHLFVPALGASHVPRMSG